MTFYHGTSKENWDAIQKEGVLWGRRFIVDNDGNPIKEVCRCTYLAVDREEAEQYGDVVLKVEYDPFNNPKRNNYIEDCWQIRVYEPIPLTHVKLCRARNVGLSMHDKSNCPYFSESCAVCDDGECGCSECLERIEELNGKEE